MTPKDKAYELVCKFMKCTNGCINIEEAKQCALIAVDEILPINSNPQAIKFWQEVKQEIELL